MRIYYNTLKGKARVDIITDDFRIAYTKTEEDWCYMPVNDFIVTYPVDGFLKTEELNRCTRVGGKAFDLIEKYLKEAGFYRMFVPSVEKRGVGSYMFDDGKLSRYDARTASYKRIKVVNVW